jgi:N-ethylmaleimide reductase
MPNLFDEVTIGSLTLPNRIVMAPMARSRADDLNRPGALMAEYYAQRAGAGLIVAEATAVSPIGRNYHRCPAIYDADQMVGWGAVTEAVHRRGGRIFLQLVHAGRATHAATIGTAPSAPSAIAASTKTFTASGFQPCSQPRELKVDDINAIVADFQLAARNAWKAGFDGVELHAANGYLIDQFLKDGSNHRDDEYGGSFDNRFRLLAQVVKVICSEVPATRVGVRLAPGRAQDCFDSDPGSLFSYVVSALASYSLCYIHMVEGIAGGATCNADIEAATLRRLYPGVWIANNGFTRHTAQETVREGRADLVSFGRPFISNPDLVRRLRDNLELTTPDKSTFFTEGAAGYTDYSPLQGG